MTTAELPTHEVEVASRDRRLAWLADQLEDGAPLPAALRVLDDFVEQHVDSRNVLRTLVAAGLVDVVVVKKNEEATS